LLRFIECTKVQQQQVKIPKVRTAAILYTP